MEWENEPSFYKFLTAVGYPAFVIRNESYGNLCGYVGVPKEHPFYGKHYSDKLKVPDEIVDRVVSIENLDILGLIADTMEGQSKDNIISVSMTMSVHGGITYSDDRVPFEEPDGDWWLGFDCAHAGDLLPIDPMDEMMNNPELKAAFDEFFEKLGINPHSDKLRNFNKTYKNFEFVKDEIENLAYQLYEIKDIVRKDDEVINDDSC